MENPEQSKKLDDNLTTYGVGGYRGDWKGKRKSVETRSGGKRATSNIWVTLILMCIAIGLWVAFYTGDPADTSDALLICAIAAAVCLVAYGEIVERNREPNKSNISMLGNVVTAWLIMLALGGGPILVLPAAFTIMFLARIFKKIANKENLIEQ